MSINQVENILDQGCKTLCLKSCRLTDATYLHSTFDQPLLGNQIKAKEITPSSQLINLDLYQCEFTDGFLETLMSSTHSLNRFSLTDHNICMLSYDILLAFYSKNGQTLQTLNLAFTAVVNFRHVELIVKNCTGLKEVDFSHSNLSDASIHLLVNGITKNIENFGLSNCCSGCAKSDRIVKILVSRCSKIKSLNLAGNYITNNALTSIAKYLTNSLEELDIGRCNNTTM